MPLFDFLCLDCGATSEQLVSSSSETLNCEQCGGANLRKLLSAPSSLSGAAKQSLPGVGDTTCCGSVPSMAGCAGPGSCCGKGST